MIKIPNTEKKFSQPNTSDLFGNIFYTKNMNFDEAGYVKLSSRSVSIINQDDDADFNLPVSFGRKDSGFWNVVTSGDLSVSSKPFEVFISETALSAAEDNGANVPTLANESRGEWWRNKWHVSTTSNVVYKDEGSGNDWTVVSPSLALTANKVHDLEVFRSKNTLCVTNGNSVVQLNTSYASTTNLTLPSDFEAVGLSYNNNRLAIITKISTGSLGQNQEAYLFIWDGATTSANQGFSMGTDMIIAITPYKSSWVILTRTGEIKYFNGGGFDLLSTLPLYYLNRTWGNSNDLEAWGNVLQVDGEIIYINVNSKVNPFGIKGEEYISNSPGGVLCYDAKVGLYHRYSPSISPAGMVTVLLAGVNVTTDILTANAGTIQKTGSPVKYLSSRTTKIGGLKTGTIYYSIRHTSTTFSLAETYADAVAGNKINLTSTGAATNYFMFVLVRDYGASRMRRTGGIGVAELPTHAIDNLVMGSELYEYDAAGTLEHMNFVVSGFKNIGYIVSAKITSQGVEDNTKKLFLKYRPLKAGEKIVVKMKDRNILGIPVTTPQDTVQCAWTDNNTFTTTADLSEVESFINNDGGECECEIIAGAGAGQMAQISSISVLNGTYTVNLAEEMDGAESGYICDILIENWKKLGEINDTETNGWEEFPIATSSKWVMFKVEFRGDEDLTLEELQIINTIQLAAV